MSSYRPCQETQSDTSELHKIICGSSRISFPAFPCPGSQQQGWPRVCGAWRGVPSSWHCLGTAEPRSCPTANIPDLEWHFAKSQEKGKRHEIMNLGISQGAEHSGEAGSAAVQFFAHSSNSLFNSEIVLLATGRSCGLLSLAQIPHPWEMWGLTQWETWLLEASASLFKDVWSFSVVNQGWNGQQSALSKGLLP